MNRATVALFTSFGRVRNSAETTGGRGGPFDSPPHRNTNFVGSFRGSAMVTALKVPLTFSPVLSQAVEESATAFFSGSCGMTPAPEADAGQDDEGAGIMSTISFMGDPPWAFALAFPERAAVTIAKSFAGFDIAFDSPDMGDVVGEIVNVIAGDVVGRLAKQGVAAQMSLPTTVRGDHVAILVPSGASTTRFTFAGPTGTCRFNLVGTQPTSPSVAPAPEPSRQSIAAPAPALSQANRVQPPTSEPALAPRPPSSEALAAWAAAEAEAERELAEQDAAEAALRAAGGVPATGRPAGSVTRPTEQGYIFSITPLYISIVFACFGWGAAAGLLATSGRGAPAPRAEPAPPVANASAPGAASKNPLGHIDALIHSRRFAEGLQQCIAAPKNAPGASATAIALREGLCLEGLGGAAEAAGAYQRAETDPSVVASAVAVLGRARCATRDGSYALARAIANRVLLRSGHPDCRALKMREEVRHLRAQIAALECGAAPLRAEAISRPLSTSASNCFDWVTATVVPAPPPRRDVMEVHRAFGAPGALEITVGLAPRPTIEVLRALGATGGWDVRASAAAAALLNRTVGPLEVDHMPLAEFLGVLTEGTGVVWAVQADAILLTCPERLP